MGDSTQGNVHGGEGVAVGKNIQQQLVNVTTDLNQTMQGVRDELRWMRRDLDTLTEKINRWWYAVVLIVGVVVFLAVVGDRRVNSLEQRVAELERQVITLERRVDVLSRMP